MALQLMDEHSMTISGAPPEVWEAVRRQADALVHAAHPLIGRALGVVPASGFAPDGVVEGREIALAGRHRFARYRLVFVLTDRRKAATEVSVRSFAHFPGLHGRAYRRLILTSGGHRLAVRRMLRSIRRGVGEGAA